MDDSDYIHVALVLMYGYAMRYAPSTDIEVRIDALVVWYYFLWFLVNISLPNEHAHVIELVSYGAN